ncbi:hypothetical protein CCM_01427 [Cordyceps militaris CM01]|uniref:Uncharacterized protein n=1 Tax=Cordyceps militaris (strain CM01) TaxID=983644 RepID=G3J506_CORMM|nr:uncharacterized protein CCM_01427 [Cordyceps militaris CM01]EGX96769.1 hypothetical protein CCM_01427 [Cordyceps militaris CM01]
MSPAAKRKGGDESSSDIEHIPALELKRRRCSGKADTASAAAAKDECPSSPLEDGVARTIERDELRMSPAGVKVEKHGVKDSSRREEEWLREASTATKTERPVVHVVRACVKREDTGSSDAPDSQEEPAEPQPRDQQHWRRSAAPSPFASAHHGAAAAAQSRVIRPEDIPRVLKHVLRPSADNPGRCPCGWYEFYAVCAHVARREMYRCGARRAVSGDFVFCGSPAPRHNVDDYIVDQPCMSCRAFGPVVKLSS